MAKFIKRSERKIASKQKTDSPTAGSEINTDSHSADKEITGSELSESGKFIKDLIEQYSEEKFSSVSEISTEQTLPDSDSDVIKYFNDPEEYKYTEEKRESETKRGKTGYFGRSAEAEVEAAAESEPEPKQKASRQILKAPVERSAPGSEAEDAKYSHGSTSDITDGDGSAEGKTKKFIQAEAPAEQDDTEKQEETPPPPEEKAARKRKAMSWVGNFSAEPVIMRYPEYSSEEKTEEIKAFLAKEKKVSLIKFIICACALFLSFIFSAVPLILSAGDEVRSLKIFGGNGLAYGIIMLLLFLVGIIPLAGDFIGGISILTKKKANCDTVILLMWAAVLIQNIVLLTQPDKIYAECSLYGTAALAVTAGVYFIRLAMLTKTTDGFRILISGKEISGIRPIEDSHRSAKVGQGMLDPDAKIAYRAKSSFIDKYINSSLTDDPSGGICSKILPVGIAAAVITMIITAIAKKDIASAVSSFAAVIIAVSPVPVTIALKLLLISFGEKLTPSGGCIPGYAGASSFADSDAVIFDASELYGAESFNVHGAKTFGDYKLYDMILLAAAMFIRSDSPLGGMFMNVIAGKTELLPKAESLIYEDKQGLSAWINNEKVLAGTRDMMINHNIGIPPLSFEEKYTLGDKDRKIIYLSVEGELAAIFVISYSTDPEVAKHISYLARHGFTVLLRSTDPNLNDELIERQTGLPADTIKVINTEAAEYFKMCRGEEPRLLKPGIFSAGGIIPSLRVMTYSVMLKKALNITTPLAVISSALGLAVVVVLMIFAKAVSVSGLALFILQALWTAIGAFACRTFVKK